MLEKIIKETRIITLALGINILSGCGPYNIERTGNLNAIIEPQQPDDNDDLLCYMSKEADHTYLNFDWFRNDVRVQNKNIITDYDGSHYPKTLTSSGDFIICKISEPNITGLVLYDGVEILGGEDYDMPEMQ